MGKLQIKKVSSVANEAVGTGVAQRTTTQGRKPMLVHGYTVSPRGANFAADVQVYLFNDYGGESNNLIESGDFTADADATADYTSDWSANADGWIENTNGDLTFTGNQDKSGKTDTLKITADAGGDPASFKTGAEISNGVRYKCTFSYFAETGHGCAYWALGMLNDVWDEGYDHDSGNHPAIVSNAWTDVTLYGLSDSTSIELCAVTAANGQTEDVLIGTKSIWLHNFKMYPLDTGNDGDWTRSAPTDGYWDMYNGKADWDASGAATFTYAGTNSLLTVDGIYEAKATVSSWVAGDLWLSAGGITLGDMDANGAYTYGLVPSATTALVLNGDATGDGDIDTVSLKYQKQIDNSILVLADSIYDSTIRSGETQTQIVKFPKPIICPEGWYMYFTTAGTACIMDINIFYEYM